MSKPLPRDEQPAKDEQPQINDEGRPEPPASVSHVPATGFLAVLTNLPFLSLWTAQIASQTAQNSLWYALIIMVGNLTGQSTIGVGFTILLVQLPTVFFSSIAGVLVDRVSKQSILVFTNVVRVAGVLLYALFEQHIAGLYAVTFLVGVVSQPFAPAEGSTIPLLVKGEQLITANSLFQMTFMASQAIGFAFAPIAIGFFGIRTSLFILAALFAYAAIVLVFLPPITKQHAPVEEGSLLDIAVSTWQDIGEAMEYIIHDPPLLVALVQISLAPTFLLLMAEIGQDFLTHQLHIGHAGTSLFFLLAPAGLGLGVGMFVLGQWGQRLRKDKLVLVALIGLGVTAMGLASIPNMVEFWASLHRAGLPIPSGVGITATLIPITILMGVEVAFINAPVQTIVQERAAPHLRGRILAMQQTLTAAVAIPPIILVGGLAAIVGSAATLAVMGVVLVAIGLVIVYYS